MEHLEDAFFLLNKKQGKYSVEYLLNFSVTGI